MGSVSRFSRESTDASSAQNYLIYAIFCEKDATSSSISNFIDCYDPSNNSWRRVTSIPVDASSLGDNLVLKDFSMVSLGHHIYIIGGRLCRKTVKSNGTDCIAEETNLLALNSVRRFDTRTDTWDDCRPMNSQRFDFACTVCGDKIYVAGGQGALGQARGISSAEMYDPSSDEWRFLANMSTKRYRCVGATWQGRILILGGFAERGDGGDTSLGPFIMTRSSAEVYDPEHDSWEFLARMWDLDIPPYQIVSINEKLFSSGDCLMPWKGHVETYNETEKIWNIVHGSHCHNLSQNFTQDNDHIVPMRRVYLTMAPIGNQLYFLTGYMVPGGGSRLRSEVHAFDTASNGYGWRSFEPVMEEREKELCGHCCVLKKHVS